VISKLSDRAIQSDDHGMRFSSDSSSSPSSSARASAAAFAGAGGAFDGGGASASWDESAGSQTNY
jgi:hypothetical protein